MNVEGPCVLCSDIGVSITVLFDQQRYERQEHWGYNVTLELLSKLSCVTRGLMGCFHFKLVFYSL